MAVTGIGVERHVAEYADLGHRLFDGANGAADQVLGVERFGAGLVAPAGLGIGKQRDTGMVELRRPLRGAHRFVDRKPFDAGHRGDRGAHPVPSTRNSGQIRSSVVSTCSRTMRRAHSARRLRRGRIARSRRSPGARASTGGRRMRSRG